MSTFERVRQIVFKVASTPPEESYPVLEKLNAENRSLFEVLCSSDYWALSVGEKAKLFNLWGFLFGPLYYFSKGLVLKGAFIFAAFCLWKIMLFVFAAGFGIQPWFIERWLLPCLVTSHLSSYDLFRFAKKGEVMWEGAPSMFRTPRGFVGIPLASFVVVMLLSGSKEKVDDKPQPSSRVYQEPSSPEPPPRPQRSSQMLEPNAGKCPYLTGSGVSLLSLDPQDNGWNLRYQCPEEAGTRSWTISRSTMGASICGPGRFDVRWVPCD